MKGLLVCLLLPVGLTQAIRVYLSPPPSLPPKLSVKRASFALSRHLDLESFEAPDEDSLVWDGPLHQEFVGQGPKDGLLLSIDESHVYGTFSLLPNGFTRDLTWVCRRHSEEAGSNFRDPFDLLSDFTGLPNLNSPPPRTLHLLTNLLRGVVPRTWSASITRHILRTFDLYWDVHVRNLHPTGFRRIGFNFWSFRSIRA